MSVRGVFAQTLSHMAPRSTNITAAFETGNTIQLQCSGSGHALRVDYQASEPTVDARGGIGRAYYDSNWKVTVHSKSACIVSLKNGEHNLGLHNGRLLLKRYKHGTKPGQECQFFVRETETGRVLLEPLFLPGSCVAAGATGRMLSALQTQADCGLLTVYLVGRDVNVYSTDEGFAGMAPERVFQLPLVPDGADEVPPMDTPLSMSPPLSPTGSSSMVDWSSAPSAALHNTRRELENIYSPTSSPSRSAFSPVPGSPRRTQRQWSSDSKSGPWRQPIPSPALEQSPSPVYSSHMTFSPQASLDTDESQQAGVSDF